MSLRNLIKKKSPPIIGEATAPSGVGVPINQDQKLIAKYEEGVDKFIDAIKETGYIESTRSLVEKLEKIVSDLGLTNQQVPQFWTTFGTRLAKNLAKVDEDKRDEEMIQQDFNAVWNIFSRRHNKILHSLKYKDLLAYGNEETEQPDK